MHTIKSVLKGQMFEFETKFLNDFNLNLIKKPGRHLTYTEIAASGIHPAVLKYISAEIDYLLFEDRRRLADNSTFDYSGTAAVRYLELIGQELKNTKRFNTDYLSGLILQASAFNINYVVRPRWSLTELLFSDAGYLDTQELRQRFRYVYYYDYLISILEKYVSRKKLVSVSREEFSAMAAKADAEVTRTYTKNIIVKAVYAFADIFNAGTSSRRIPLKALEMFLQEKDLGDYGERISAIVAADPKAKMDISEVQRILFSDAVSAVKPAHAEETPISESPAADVSPELVPDTPGRLLNGNFIDRLIEKNKPEEKSEEKADITEGGSVPENPSASEIVQVPSEVSETESSPETESLAETEGSPETEEVIETEDSTDEGETAETADIQEAEILNETHQPEIFISADEEEEEDLPEEIFAIEENYPDDEDIFIIDETGEPIAEAGEDRDTAPPEEESAGRLSETTGEISEAAEPEAAEPEAAEPEAAEPEAAEPEAAETVLKEIEGAEPEQEEPEQEEPEQPTATHAENTGELSPVKENTAGEETVAKADNAPGEEEDIHLIGSEEEIILEQDEKEYFLTRAPEEKKPSRVHKKDIIEFFSEKDINRILSGIFNGNVDEFAQNLTKISRCSSREEAMALLAAILKVFSVKPHAKEAVRMADIISEYFES